jgi:hypothetical protein
MGQTESQENKPDITLKIITNDHDVTYYRLSSNYHQLLDQMNRHRYHFEGNNLVSVSHQNIIPKGIPEFILAFRNNTWVEFAVKIADRTINDPGLPRYYEIAIKILE